MNQEDSPIPQAAIDRLVRLVRIRAFHDAREPKITNADRLKRLRNLRAEVEKVRLSLDMCDPDIFEIDWDLHYPAHRVHEIIADLAALEKAIANQINDIPKSRRKMLALGCAATGVAYLHEISEFELLRSNDSEAVRLLRSICIKAGLHYSPERCRNALSFALKRCPNLDCSSRNDDGWIEHRLRRYSGSASIRNGAEELTFQNCH